MIEKCTLNELNPFVCIENCFMIHNMVDLCDIEKNIYSDIVE